MNPSTIKSTIVNGSARLIAKGIVAARHFKRAVDYSIADVETERMRHEMKITEADARLQHAKTAAAVPGRARRILFNGTDPEAALPPIPFGMPGSLAGPAEEWRSGNLSST